MPPVLASRADTLDGILDELPDFSEGYFSYPVDDFFSEYVERLGQGGAQDLSQATPGARPMQLTDLDPNSNGIPPATSQHLRHGAQMSTLMSMELGPFDMQGPAVFLPQNVQSNGPSQYPPTMLQMPAIGNTPREGFDGINSEGSGSLGGSGDLNGTTSRGRATRARVNSDYHLDSADDSDEGEDQHRKGSRPQGKAKRNAKQQAQNKQAQQRYRERRKQRFNDMEHAIDELNTRLQQMQTIKSQNAHLMAKSNELSSVIEAKNAEIDKLKGQVQEGGLGNNTLEQSYEQRRQAEEALLHDLQGQAAKNVQELRECVDKYNLMSANPTGEGVDHEVLQRMSEILGRQCGSITKILRPDGVNLMRLMSADAQQMGRLNCTTTKQECLSKGLQNMRLTEQQKQHLLLLRTNHLNNLKDIYVERQQLNMQAMGFMLPSSQSQGGQTLESKLERMRQASYRRMAAQSVNLDQILSSIKENLRKEQRRVMELNFVTIHRILSPIQAAIYVVGIHPMGFDALELANFLAMETDGNASAQSERSLFSGASGYSINTNGLGDQTALLSAAAPSSI